MRIRAEQVVPIGPLPTSAEAGPSEAARLFATRVGQRGTSSPTLVGDEPEIEEICQHAGGIPLAIEIAASTIGAIRPAILLDRLRRQGATLLDQRGPVDLPERQQSLATVLGATVGMLEEGALDLARRIAVAKGPLSLEMLEAITSDRPRLLDHLDELIGASLVVEPDDTARVRMPVPVMEYVMRSNEDPSTERTGAGERGTASCRVAGRHRSMAPAAGRRPLWSSTHPLSPLHASNSSRAPCRHSVHG